jgi:acyl-CoA synthetase (AMP-forming)/AMP-acid ligase II
MNIRELLENRVKMSPDKVYLYFQDQEVRYKDFDNRVNKVANSLLRSGIGKGDHVAIMLPNSPEFLYCWFGLNKIGAVEVPVNLNLKGEELKYILGHSEAKGVVINFSYLSLLESIRENLPALKLVVVIGGEKPTAAGSVLYQDWIMGASEELQPVSISDDDPAVIIYTSGTTGDPKGVVLSHRGWVLTGESWAYMIGALSNDRIMTSNPLFHANAQCYSTMGSLAANASLVLLERFSRSNILEQARLYRADIIVLVGPAMPMVWSRTQQVDDGDTPARTIMAGGVPNEYYYDFEKRLQVKIQTAYTLTEATMAIMAPREGIQPRKPTPGVGVIMEHPDPSVKNEVKIIDESGAEVPRNTHGQIVVKNPAVMIGYLKDPQKTTEINRDGWIYTGDVGYQDEDGYFFFVGRSKDVLRRRGELISPTQIESVINTHPKVEDSVVIGVPSGLGTAEEEVKAYVILNPGETVSPQEIIEWCVQRLADFKVPRSLEFRTAFPRTPLGKIQKSLLKQEKEDLTEGCYDREKEGKAS